MAFELAVENQSHVVVITVNSNEWQDTRRLDFIEPSGDISPYGIELSSWTSDGKSILCQDMNSIYEIGTDGTLLQKIPIESIAREVQRTGGMSFSYSPDRKYILFSATRELKTGAPNNAIYLFDVEKREAMALTPETIDAAEAVWLPSGREILFERVQDRPDDAAVFDLCTMSLNAPEIKTVLRDASAASYSAR